MKKIIMVFTSLFSIVFMGNLGAQNTKSAKKAEYDQRLASLELLRTDLESGLRCATDPMQKIVYNGQLAGIQISMENLEQWYKYLPS